MAIARGAGTEIVRSASFEDIAGTTATPIIKGEQHHIYTVLSMVIWCTTLDTAGQNLQCYITGYDSYAGTTGQNIYIFEYKPNAYNETFVWNDKFSFNGHEPTDFAGPMDDATKQNAIADQGSSTGQKLMVVSNHASTAFDVTVTFIDQNNA
tara:strand:- start:23 stop:478 length:456 start_codon:yes stop_codon:yes gene_type:complete